MNRLLPISLCVLALLADGAGAERPREVDLADLSSRLAAPSIDDRLAAVEGLFAWSLSAEEPGQAMALLERATRDPSTEIATQAEHCLRLLAARRPGLDGNPLSDRDGADSRARRGAAQLRDLEVWRARLANGAPADRLQAVKALAAHALVGAQHDEVVDLLEMSLSDRDLAVAAQARAALEQLARRKAD